MKKIDIFDSTLRDGAQGEGIAFTVDDKLKIIEVLDRLGVRYIEAGNPGSNPKEVELFERARDLRLARAELVAFGSTRRSGISAAEDANVKSLLAVGAKAVAVFGKAWDLHVTDVLKTTLTENLEMIRDTLNYLREHGRKVIFDAEHFFDGYKENPGYAMATLGAAVEAGAEVLALCDTCGGGFPEEISEITALVVAEFPNIAVGIHCHNDGGMAVANSVVAVEAGATHVQGTLIGIGERCGNANLSGIIGNLQLKRGYECIPADKLPELTAAARKVADVANINLENGMPFVGNSAFAHKGGMHIDGVSKVARSFEHVAPDSVGNARRFLMSEVSGRRAVLKTLEGVAPGLTKDSPEAAAIMDELKRREHQGYQYEAAEASFELMALRALGRYDKFFELHYFKTTGEKMSTQLDLTKDTSTAVVKIGVGGVTEVTAAEGDGPVNALDKALRKALEVFYPQLSAVALTDFKVRVLEARDATASKVRVLIESSDGAKKWTTVGVSADIIEASWIALVDSLEYKLYKG